MFLTQDQAEVRLNSEKNLARASFLRGNARSENSTGALHTDEFKQSDSAIVPEDHAEELPHGTRSVTEKVIPLSGKNRINLTTEERTNIAIESRLGTKSQTEIARANNLRVLTVANIHSGKTKGIDEERVKQVTNNVRDLALERLMASLGLLTDDKLTGCSAKDLSTIASNMGRVVEKIQDKVETPDNINFIIYSPELKQEHSFKVIEV